jgi:type I restriction enzyme S subunit
MEYIELSDLCTPHTKNIAVKDVANQKGKYPVFGATGLVGFMDSYQVANEYVGVIKDGAGIGRTNIYPAKSSLIGTMQCLLPKDGINVKYLMYLVRSLKLGSSYSGATIPHIYYKNYKNTKILKRELKQQLEIANTLENIEQAIQVKEEQLKALDELIQSCFTEMFGNIKIKKKISDLCLVNPRKPKNIDDNLIVSFLPMANVGEQGNIDLSITRPYKEVKKGFTYFQDNDILFAKITPCMENGKGALVTNLKNHIGFGSTEFHVIRVQDDLIPQYLFAITQSKPFRKLAKGNMTGSVGQQRVPASFLENFLIPVPPLTLQNQFADFVQQVERAKEIVKIQIKDLQELLAIKMDEYFK